MSSKQILLDLDDKRIGVLSEVLGNKTSKKIIDYLADNEASETEIARDLKIPANTINYNVKKLLESGLIEKTKDSWWSVKGKKISKYKVANMKIIISPKSKSKIVNGFLALIGTVGVGFVLQKFFLTQSLSASKEIEKNFVQGSVDVADFAVGNATALEIPSSPEVLLWVVFGALIFMILYFLIGKIRD